MSYWNEKGKPNAVPLMATHYAQKDEYDAHFGYDHKGRMPGDMFRSKYEEANVAQPVGIETLARPRTLAAARSRTIVKDNISADEP